MSSHKEKIFSSKDFWQAVATLVGTVIGAGILGIPYVVAKVGVVSGIIIVAVLGIAIMLIHLMIAEVMMRTRYRHQLPGLVRKYLGEKYEYIQSFGLLLGGYGALTAYIIGEGEVLSALFGMSEKALMFSLLFLILGAFFLAVGLKLIKIIEYWMVWLILAVILIVIFWSIPYINVENFNYSSITEGLLVYGVVIFALGGMNAIFSVREILRKKEHLVRPAIITGSLIPLIIYILFAVAVVGVVGFETTEIATIGLGEVMGSHMLILGNLFAVFAMATSFFVVGLSLKQLYHYDYHLPEWLAWILVVLFPVLIFFYVSHDFTEIIGVAGGITFGFTGVLMVLSYWKAKKMGDQKPFFSLPKFHLTGFLLILMFIIGMIYTISQLFS